MKNLKKFVALVLTGAMVIGSTTMVFAEGDTSLSSDGTGTYEGNKMSYPTLSVTLPTITAGTYNYIADPNGNLKATNGGSLGTSLEGKLKSTTGIYFTNGTGSNVEYTETSDDYKVVNQNAQDIQVTASVKVKTAGASGIKYSETSDFSGDTVKATTAIYFALQNGAKTKTSVLKGAGTNDVAELTLVVKGNKDNYEPKYTASPAEGHEKYEYALKGTPAADSWKSCVFNLTGALNQNVSWEGDSSAMTFPELTVTYKYAEVPVMTGDAANGYSYTWTTGAPTGTIQSLSIDGVERPGIITNQKITYASSKLALDPAPVANFGLATGNHTIVVSIGTAESATEYTLNIEN